MNCLICTKINIGQDESDAKLKELLLLAKG